MRNFIILFDKDGESLKKLGGDVSVFLIDEMCKIALNKELDFSLLG
jgi:hypothetical protein